MITRRSFVKVGSLLGCVAATGEARSLALAQDNSPADNNSPTGDPWTSGGMGISSTSLVIHRHPAGPPRDNSIAYLEYCHSLGAIGVQMEVKGDLAKFRQRAENLNMFIEYEARLPERPDDDLYVFEKSLEDAKAVGATCMRVVSTTHRRYEFFTAMADYQDWKNRSTAVVEKIVPLAEKHRVILAMENHKDRTADEFAALLKQISSEYYGSLIDFGNNIALCEEPMSVVSKLAPYVKSMHLKDMAVKRYDQGFLLSEVVCGRGFLDLKGMVTRCRRSNPKVHINLEMITGPCFEGSSGDRCILGHFSRPSRDRSAGYSKARERVRLTGNAADRQLVPGRVVGTRGRQQSTLFGLGKKQPGGFLACLSMRPAFVTARRLLPDIKFGYRSQKDFLHAPSTSHCDFRRWFSASCGNSD